FEFLENFNYPYVSSSITEFWRRWHISLSTWFKEYVYIPLGGNRKGVPRQFLNIAVVWFITGFWHGASWNYILWGVYFGAILMLEKVFMLKALKKLPNVVGHIYALVLIVFGWLIFAFEDAGEGLTVLKAMFGSGTQAFATSGTMYDLLRYLPLLIVCIFGATPVPKRIYERLTAKYTAARYVGAVGAVCVILLCVAYMVDNSFSPFLYFIF
ncbi:MAG TPA: MBOAT family O-acyltransferase, partial [Bacillota bacterium]|nr:MBOAT family O-acyltransferase [Bacillota bacterium]